jgi:RNA binding exosome subunit
MNEQLSYVKHQNALIHQYRERINHAESEQDIKRMFFQIMKDLFIDIFEDDLGLEFNHVNLRPDEKTFFRLDSQIAQHPRLHVALEHSDLQLILSTFAKQACHHLQRHPENTERKIRI